MDGHPVGIKVDGNYLKQGNVIVLARDFLEADEIFSGYALTKATDEHPSFYTNRLEQIPADQIRDPVTPFRGGIKIHV